ncbi:MBL fold metallo-hydrolase [Pseudoroseomonas rhizosphaerae]|uniref:MBL fold metallo-hydrolase n=1 Tax=Teichococcus rhizosphaerae TaxID=1335062 RepID=A0A2C7A164_9PROT|nr:MBL fold metallo-hydrolase [Pseudoroseomonas rhizosphaerae]PHK93788.1 MBL fold metallo-hydrolase [Pseudoroseomonas rhizosphaerae]
MTENAAPLPPPPEPGAVAEIRPGLRWARMPLPFPPHHVNLWLLEDGAGWLAVDAGARTDESVGLWSRILEEGLEGRPITRLLATHFHPDHVGFAGWLCERTGASLLMPRAEYLMSRFLCLDTDEGMTAQQLDFARMMGGGEDYLAFLAARGPLYARAVMPLPRQYRRIAQDDRIAVGGREWRVMTGGGHAPEMAALHCESLGVLIAADQVLPRISPYVGVGATEPEADPLRDFLESNARLRALPAETLVLPSHGEPFFGLHERIDALAAHHAERLGTLEAACATPLTAFEAAGVLFPRVREHRPMGFALGETLAHLNRLVGEGRAVREAGDVPRYRRTKNAGE